jgi:sugar-specific transcriptional regulator TrmB
MGEGIFRAISPREVFERIKRDYSDFLRSVQATLEKEVNEMKEKFVIKKNDIGFEKLKEQIRKAKTIWMSNATTDFLKKVDNAFSKDAEEKVLLFPGERRINYNNVQFKEAEAEIVCMIRNREVPSMSVILDESRIFMVIEDPVKHCYIVDEMLYDECSGCFSKWFSLGWESARDM